MPANAKMVPGAHGTSMVTVDGRIVDNLPSPAKAPSAAPSSEGGAGRSHGAPSDEAETPIRQAHQRFAALPPRAEAPQRDTLFDILDREDYETAVANGYIRTQTHPDPDVPYLIHNYTEACAWEQAWTPASLACRGLITHAETGEVIARPFAKFFNHEQPGAPILHLDDEVVVTDKKDGSLAILYPLPNGEYAVATRGSFASDQAQWATAKYQQDYAHRFTPELGHTYLMEIVYPENRIVVDYGDTEDLFLLGAVDNHTGRSIPLHDLVDAWPGPSTEILPHTTLREVLEAPERDNAEGFVIWHPALDVRVKVKHDQYKLLHKFFTNTSEKHVWEVLATSQDPDIMFAAAPDEFHEWMRGVVADLRSQHAALTHAAYAAYQEVVASLPAGFTRKDFAMVASQHPEKSLLFLLLDGRDTAEILWQRIKPSGARTVRTVNPSAD